MYGGFNYYTGNTRESTEKLVKLKKQACLLSTNQSKNSTEFFYTPAAN
jgi:hypothetical protein